MSSRDGMRSANVALHVRDQLVVVEAAGSWTASAERILGARGLEPLSPERAEVSRVEPVNRNSTRRSPNHAERHEREQHGTSKTEHNPASFASRAA
jgi:glycine/D-amino acid oxidase-like deaminating enzyme